MTTRSLARASSSTAVTAVPRTAKAALALIAIALTAASCSGERPVLLPPNATTTATTLIAGTEVEVAALTEADCVTAVGGTPWQVSIEAVTTAVVPCVLLGAHQRIEYINNTAEVMSLDINSTSITINPTESFITEPAGTIFQPGINEVGSSPHPVSAPWFVEAARNSLNGALVGLAGIGDVDLGLAPAEVTAASGGLPVPASGTPCFVSSIEGDPYSPLFTFRDGGVAVVQVFTPGQLTRSDIGIGSTEGDVLAAYGQQIESQPSPDGDPNKKLLVFVPVDEADQVHRLVFELENDMVVSLRNGLTQFAVTDPGCPAG
jgi:hypothetical protein